MTKIDLQTVRDRYMKVHSVSEALGRRPNEKQYEYFVKCLIDSTNDVPELLDALSVEFKCQTHMCGSCGGCKAAGIEDENTRLRKEVENLKILLAGVATTLDAALKAVGLGPESENVIIGGPSDD